jgi:PAS domain S-box-containing protein
MVGATTTQVRIDDHGKILNIDGDLWWMSFENRDSTSGKYISDLVPESMGESIDLGLRQLRESRHAWLIGQKLAFAPDGYDVASQGIELEVQHSRERSGSTLNCEFRDMSAQANHDRANLFQAALLTAQHHVSLDGIVIVSPDDTILFYNDRYLEIWDIPAELMENGCINEVRKETATRVVDPDGTFLEVFAQYDDSLEISRDELLLHDGRMLLRHSAPVLDEDGTWLGRYWSYREITEYRRMQRVIEEQTERLSSLVDNNPDMVISLDFDGVIQSANPGVLAIYGYEPEDVVGQHRDMLISQQTRDIVYHNVAQVDRGEPRQFETAVPHRDGHEVDVSVKLIPILVRGEIVGHWAVVHDMTHIKETHAELQRARVNLERAQRISGTGSYEWDAATDSLTLSSELYRIFRLDPDSFDSSMESMTELIHPEDRENLLTEMQDMMARGEPYDMDIRVIRTDGVVRHVHAVGEVTFDEVGSPLGMAGTAIDITERKQEEEALQHLVSLLEEKTSALEQTTAEQEAFIYSVSHDLRSPLISIQGLAEIVHADYSETLDDTATQYLNRIMANVRRMQDMLSGLLELSRIGRTEKGSRRDVDLHQVVEDIIDDLRDSAIGKHAEFRVEGQLPTIRAHESRMSQLFTNLLDNAVKYTPQDRQPVITIRSGEVSGGWNISVQDNGVGIPAEYQGSALAMFSRLPQGQRLNPTGSGLGLAIVSRIVAAHGGKLKLESGESEGTTISFTLA